MEDETQEPKEPKEPIDCTPDHGVGHPDCPKCWHRSPRNPYSGK